MDDALKSVLTIIFAAVVVAWLVILGVNGVSRYQDLGYGLCVEHGDREFVNYHRPALACRNGTEEHAYIVPWME